MVIIVPITGWKKFRMLLSNTFSMISVPASEDRENESLLVTAAKLGDGTACRAIFDLYNTRIFNLIYYNTGDVISAEDLLQVVFFKVFRGLPGFRHQSSLLTWIYRIAINECQNYLKRRGLRYVPFEAILGTEEEFAPQARPDELRAATEKREIIRLALMELSPKLRSVVVLKYMDDLSYDEIAAVLDCSQGTVASRLNRALEKLEKSLGPMRGLL